jgi:hypothetical protein
LTYKSGVARSLEFPREVRNTDFYVNVSIKNHPVLAQFTAALGYQFVPSYLKKF